MSAARSQLCVHGLLPLLCRSSQRETQQWVAAVTSQLEERERWFVAVAVPAAAVFAVDNALFSVPLTTLPHETYTRLVSPGPFRCTAHGGLFLQAGGCDQRPAGLFAERRRKRGIVAGACLEQL